MLFANSVVDTLTGINLWGFLAVLVVCGVAADVAKRFMRHKERLAMIQAGMNPDGPEADAH